MRCSGISLFLLAVLLGAGCTLYTQEPASEPPAGIGVAVLDSIQETFSVDVERLPVPKGDESYAVWRAEKEMQNPSLLGFVSVDESGRGQLSGVLSKEAIENTGAVFITVELGAAPQTPSPVVVLSGSNQVSADIINLKLETPLVATEPVPEETPAALEEVEIPEIVETIVETPEPVDITAPEPAEVMEEPETTAAPIPPEEDAIVLIVEETELVQLQTEAADPDGDTLSYSFTTPLDNNGQWQTTYGDEGEYTVTVSASDGSLTTTQDVLIIINKKEEAPVINSFRPPTLAAMAEENSELIFSVEVSDVNGDFLSYRWLLDGEEAGTSAEYTYLVSYDDAGAHTVKAEVSDGTLTAEQVWSVTVNNLNRAPVVEDLTPISVKETETVRLDVKASDPDGDALTVTIPDPVGNDGVWETTYDDAGTYPLTVSVSDGETTVTTDVEITVENVNRAPVIKDIIKG